jgi:hypothetical protein
MLLQVSHATAGVLFVMRMVAHTQARAQL